jgi:predicted permease
VNLLFETKYALRRLKKAPAYTAMSLTVISLSIALSVVVLAVVYNLTWKPMGFPGMEGWQAVRSYTPGGWRGGATDSTIYWGLSQGKFESISDIGAYDNSTVLLDDGVATYSLASRRMTPNLIQASNEIPLLGRLIADADAEPNSTPVVMLSYTAWQQYYSGDTDIIGQQTRIDGQARAIVGVLREDSKLIHGAFWFPITKNILDEDTGLGQLQAMVKLRERVDSKLANQEIGQLLTSLKTEYPGRVSDSTEWRLLSLNNLLFQNGEPIFLSLSAVTPILLMLACLSIGTLLFARILEQYRQIAIRQAVGSSPWQTSGQASVESLVLCIGGCLIGVIIAYIAILNLNYFLDGYWSNHIQGAENPHQLRFSFSLFLVAGLAGFVIWVASGLLPAIRAAKASIAATLSSTTKGAVSGATKLSSILIATQIVLGCFLLILSGTYAYQNIYQTYLDRGVDTEGLATASVTLGGQYSDQTGRIQYLDSLQHDLRSLPAVNEVAYTTALPDNFSPQVSVSFEEGNDELNQSGLNHVITYISDNYFDAVNLPVIQGRTFDAQDSPAAQGVVIVDDYFAKQFWPNGSAIGRQIRLQSASGSNWFTIVGVSKHVRRQVADNRFTIYRPLRQQVPSFPSELLLLVDHNQPLAAIRRDLAATASSLNRDIPLTNILTIEGYQLATWGWRMVQSHIFAWTYSVVLLLVALSIFAVLARSIVQQIRDIGVRRALGSNNHKVMGLYIRKGLAFVLIGSTVGTGFALITSNWLMDLGRSDEFPNFVGDVSIVVISTLTLFILIAVYLPARKAISLEPGDALRYD